MIDKRFFTIIVAVIALLLLMVVLAASLTQPRSVALHVEPSPSDIEVNGVNQRFTQDMKVRFTEKITIRITHSGYQSYEHTFDPAETKDQQLKITLQKVSPTVSDAEPLTAKTNLEQAAKNADPSIQAEAFTSNAAIVSAKTFITEQGTYIFYILSRTSSVGSETSMLLIDNSTGQYNITIGPGTDFGEASSIPQLPDVVMKYLKEIGAVYEG